MLLEKTSKHDDMVVDPVLFSSRTPHLFLRSGDRPPRVRPSFLSSHGLSDRISYIKISCPRRAPASKLPLLSPTPSIPPSSSPSPTSSRQTPCRCPPRTRSSSRRPLTSRKLLSPLDTCPALKQRESSFAVSTSGSFSRRSRPSVHLPPTKLTFVSFLPASPSRLLPMLWVSRLPSSTDCRRATLPR